MIAQISDVHVRPQGMRYQDLVDSNTMLAHALDTLNRLEPAPDLVVITGDLSDEGHPDEYAALRALLAQLQHPFVVMPGNHDQRANLRDAFNDHPWLPSEGALNFAMDVGSVRLIALDTSVPGEHHGKLDDTTLAWLDRELAAHADQRAIIAMHHPPFATGIPYLDLYGLHDADAFIGVVNRHANVDRIIAGHVHRSMQTRVGNVPVLTCPSTTTQIALRVLPDAEPASFMEPPGFMLHRWAAAGPGVSHLCFVGQFAGPLPFA